MHAFPLAFVERLFQLPFLKRPPYLAAVAAERPAAADLRPGQLVIEMRGGHSKWVHLACPKCGEPIQLPVAVGSEWSVLVDVFRRPTVSPSIWETGGCGAHFFIRHGRLIWCKQLRRAGASGSH